MVTKSKKAGRDEKKGRVNVGDLHLNKETIRDLTGAEQKNIKGGRRAQASYPQDTCDTCMCCTRFNTTCYLSQGGTCNCDWIVSDRPRRLRPTKQAKAPTRTHFGDISDRK